MPRTRKEPEQGTPRTLGGFPAAEVESLTEGEELALGWPVLRVRVPPDWKRWLEEAAAARALSVAALVRQCIRALMVTRHENEADRR